MDNRLVRGVWSAIFPFLGGSGCVYTRSFIPGELGDQEINHEIDCLLAFRLKHPRRRVFSGFLS